MQGQSPPPPQPILQNLKKKLTANTMVHPSLVPKDRILTCTNKSPIVVAIDVTGSMGNWGKVVYDKLPMFYGQLLLQNYLKDPAISFVAVGDASCDMGPIQVTEFAQGAKIDDWISKIWLEGKGGAGYHESYELAAHFYARRCKLADTEKAFFFFIGDESFYPIIAPKTVSHLFGDNQSQPNIKSDEVFAELRKKFHVFLIHKPYYDKKLDQEILQHWESVVGSQNILHLADPKAVIDVMLGTISMVAGARTHDKYLGDMQSRGQTKERIDVVTHALSALRLSEEKNKGISSNVDSRKQKLKHVLNLVGSSIPSDYLCPITREIFSEPVLTEDGHTFERAAIELWLNSNDTSPFTGKKLTSKALIPNHALRKAIEELCQKFGVPLD